MAVNEIRIDESDIAFGEFPIWEMSVEHDKIVIKWTDGKGKATVATYEPSKIEEVDDPC